uniref:Uncharacterized protein n=1 Tax=Hippocampus comes TaxID=109280 RepID=A0A3Q3D922_HIPCM
IICAFFFPSLPQALMHYAGSRNSIDHGLPLLEVYCLSINCFAAARSHLTAESDKVTLVLKRLALSCFELFLSVPDNEIPYEAWVQFHQAVQIAHDTLLQYGSTDLQALLQITGEGGAWSNPILAALLSGQPTIQQEVTTREMVRMGIHLRSEQGVWCPKVTSAIF